MKKEQGLYVPEHMLDRIREEYLEPGMSMARLGQRYNLSEMTVWRIVNFMGKWAKGMERTLPPPAIEGELAEKLRASAEGVQANVALPIMPATPAMGESEEVLAKARGYGAKIGLTGLTPPVNKEK